MHEVVLYDTNFTRRKELAEQLNTSGLNIIECYSIPKLERVLKTKDQNGSVCIVVGPNDAQEVLDLISPSRHSGVFFNPSDAVERIVQEVRSAAAKATLSIKGAKRLATGAYKCDLLLVGSSTGGFPVVQELFDRFKAEKTITIICQHIGEEQSEQIYEPLSKRVLSNTVLVKGDTVLEEGHVYILGGGKDYLIKLKYGKLYLVVEPNSTTAYHPSFNSLLESLEGLNGLKCSCIFLSGLGDDGSKALSKLKNRKGIMVVAQDPADSIAPYMPSAAIQTGNVQLVYNKVALKDFIGRAVL